jgi:hypothetical protein
MNSEKPQRRARSGGAAADWRVYRPAIWLAMLGIAVVLLVYPPWIGAAPLGAAIGVALKIRRQRG